MTCSPPRRTSLPVLLLAAREAEAEYRRLNDAYSWADLNGYDDTADRLFPECQTAYGAWMKADETYQRAKVDAKYAEYRPDGAGHDAAVMPF